MTEEKVTAADLLARLKRHYIKPGDAMPGGVFLPEVTHGRAGGRRADAIFVGFFQSRGRYAFGHEIKVSRADWLHELDQPEKAEAWVPECHAWYVVAPNADMVKPEELPHGWGLMIPSARTKTRMDIIVKAELYPERAMSWLGTHALVQRMDSIGLARHGEIAANGEQVLYELEQKLGLPYRKRGGDTEERLRAIQQKATELSDVRAGLMPEKLAAAEAKVKAVCEALGIDDIVVEPGIPWRYSKMRSASVDEIRSALTVEMGINDHIRNRVHEFSRLETDLEHILADTRKAREVAEGHVSRETSEDLDDRSRVHL